MPAPASIQAAINLLPDVGSDEWTYYMRRSMQEILPGLYLGPYSAAVKSNLPALEAVGITHIICIRQDIEAVVIKPHFPERFRYLTLDVADSSTENIMRFFTVANDFIENCLALGGRCLVHGNGGISRSATLVIAYVMQKYNLTHRDSYKYVQSKRFCVGPNDGFMSQLAEYEPIYQAMTMPCNNFASRPKRKFVEEDCNVFA